MRRAIVIATLLLAFIASTMGQESPDQAAKRSTRNHRANGSPCLFDFERGEVPDCIRATPAGKLFIAPRYMRELSFDSHGLSAVRSNDDEWMYVNHAGRVLISGVATCDNWADSFHDGVVRIVRNKKYGFANRKGQVVVAPIYDGALIFERGRAKVCEGCERRCAEVGCEYHLLVGGEWFEINTKGDSVPIGTPEYAR
jgi:hypothetical protein